MKYACRETQSHAGKWAWALNFGEFSGSDKAKEEIKIIDSIFLCMRVTIPGTHGIKQIGPKPTLFRKPFRSKTSFQRVIINL